MSEENKKNDAKKDIKEGSEQIKSEAKNTFNEAKESIKNVNFKNDAKVTSGYVTGLFKKPLETIKEVANDSKNAKFKYALILLILWLVVILIESLFGNHWSFINVGNKFLDMIKDLLAPIIGISAISGIAFFMQKSSKKKSLTTILTTVLTAVSPLILANVLTILTLISRDISKIVNPIYHFANVLTIVFSYFGLKAILGDEENSKFVNKFIIIEAIYYAIYFVFTFLGIYIPMI